MRTYKGYTLGELLCLGTLTVCITILMAIMLIGVWSNLAHAECCKIGVVMDDGKSNYQMVVKCDSMKEPELLTKCKTVNTRVLNMPVEILLCCNDAPKNSDEYYCVGTYVPTTKEDI